MGYSKSKKTIDRVRPVLDMLVKNDVGLLFPSKNPTKLSYAIRDALHVVNKLPDSSEDKQYQTIRQRFRIRIKPDGVLFEKREQLQYDTPIEALAAQRETILTLPHISSIIEVVGAIIHEPAKEYIFPNVLPTDEEWSRLLSWCIKNNYRIHEFLPLTIIKHESPAATDGKSVQGES